MDMLLISMSLIMAGGGLTFWVLLQRMKILRSELSGLIVKLTGAMQQHNEYFQYLFNRDTEMQRHVESVEKKLKSLEVGGDTSREGLDDLLKHFTTGAITFEDNA